MKADGDALCNSQRSTQVYHHLLEIDVNELTLRVEEWDACALDKDRRV
jgi:hypothetical protein